MDYSISEAEWKIMQVLWKNPNITLSDIVDNISYNKWSYSTVKTLLKRLSDKNVVFVDKTVGNTFRYRAGILENECKINEANSFLNKVFEGSLPTFLAAFLNDKKLSPREIAELQEMISKTETESEDENDA